MLKLIMALNPIIPASLGLLLSFAPASAQQEPVISLEPADIAFLERSTAQLKDLFCRTQFTIAGDTNHNKHEILEFIGNGIIFDAMDQCNIRHIFMEQHPNTQAYYDALMNSDLDEQTKIEQFMASMKQAGFGTRGDDVLRANAQIALEAKDRSITLYAAQMPTGAAHITQIKFYTEIGLRLYEEVLPEDMRPDFHRKVFEGGELDEERWTEILKALEERQEDPKFKSAQDAFAKADQIKAQMEAEGISRANDALLYEYVLERVQDDERALIIIGDGHPSEPKIGIYDRLGPENASWFSVYEDVREGITRNGALQPELIIDLQNRTIFKPGS